MSRPSAHDKFPQAVDGNLRGSMSILERENFAIGSLYEGEIFYELRDGSSGNLIESGSLGKNIVTRDASILVARLMKSPASPNVSEPRFGCFALAMGTGDVGWDPMNPPAATKTQRSLYNEIGRKQFAVTSFVTSGGAISSIPTNVVDLTTTFSESEVVGPLTEMGIIGGDVDTNMAIRNPILPANGMYDPTVDVVGKDLLVNYKTFKVINKPAGTTISYTWRLSF